MPYIKKADRKRLNLVIDALTNILAMKKENSGEYVYVFYKILKTNFGNGNFEQRSNPIKILEQTKDEYQRRIIHPYENQKIKENGDIE